jgi:pyridinium-3,5-bisthiocarboxylic acid mononucleotide nickel chelatase
LTTVAWWNCSAGIAGDMALASLIDAGADIDEVVAGLEGLPVKGWHIEVAKTTRAGVAASQLRAHIDPASDLTERTWGTIRAIIEQAPGLPERARARAQAVFARLAAAEGRLHGLAPEEVHFHEVGGLDAIVDVVGTCLALESLGVGSVRSGPVALGTGTVRGAHGLLPNPAPAVVELLVGAPVRGAAREEELTTPTGAALLTALAGSFGPLPSMTIRSSGYGAGSRDLDGTANVLQVVIGELETEAPGKVPLHQDLVVLEANVDDVTGEVLAHTVGELMRAGALDAWLVPVVAKKGRPAHIVSVLAEPGTVARLATVLTQETGTLGFREHSVARSALVRRSLEVEVSGERVRVKAGPYQLKAEHDDCARAAAHLGLPLSEVARQAEQAARARLTPVA